VNLCPFKIGFVQEAQIREGFHSDGNGRPHVGQSCGSLTAYFFAFFDARFFAGLASASASGSAALFRLRFAFGVRSG
jgi:hypothetical protein